MYIYIMDCSKVHLVVGEQLEMLMIWLSDKCNTGEIMSLS